MPVYHVSRHREICISHRDSLCVSRELGNLHTLSSSIASRGVFHVINRLYKSVIPASRLHSTERTSRQGILAHFASRYTGRAVASPPAAALVGFPWSVSVRIVRRCALRRITPQFSFHRLQRGLTRFVARPQGRSFATADRKGRRALDSLVRVSRRVVSRRVGRTVPSPRRPR